MSGGISDSSFIPVWQGSLYYVQACCVTGHVYYEAVLSFQYLLSLKAARNCRCVSVHAHVQHYKMPFKSQAPLLNHTIASNELTGK